jgi:hypothetical protein
VTINVIDDVIFAKINPYPWKSTSTNEENGEDLLYLTPTPALDKRLPTPNRSPNGRLMRSGFGKMIGKMVVDDDLDVCDLYKALIASLCLCHLDVVRKSNDRRSLKPPLNQ